MLANSLQTLNENALKGECRDKYQSYAKFVIQHADLNTSLANDKKFRAAFFAHFGSVHRPPINWNSIDKDALKNLIDLFFESEYASQEQLANFLKKDVCALYENKRPGCYSEWEWKFVDLTTTFFDHLTPERIDRIPALDHVEEEMLWVLSCRRHYKKRHAVLTSLYQKWPHSIWWDKIKQSSTYSGMMDLRASIVALEMQKLLKDTPIDNEEEVTDFIKSMRTLLNIFQNARGDIEAEDVIHHLLPHLETIEEAKLRAFTHAFTYDGRCSGHSNYVRAIMETDKSHLFGPMLKECIKVSYEDRLGSPFDMHHIKTKAHVVAFIQACQTLPEPVKSAYLRVLMDDENEEFVVEVKAAFTEVGLDIHHYPPLKYKLFSKAFYDRHKFAQWQAIATQEELQTAIAQFIKDHPAAYTKYFRFLAGGLQLSNGQTLKIALAEDAVKQIFESKSFIFNAFCNPIPLDEFFTKG